MTETTVRMASRVPDVPRVVELSVEEWRRQQTALLLGASNGNGDGNGNGHHDEPVVVERDVHEPHDDGDAEADARLEQWRADLQGEREANTTRADIDSSRDDSMSSGNGPFIPSRSISTTVTEEAHDKGNGRG